MHTIYRKVTPVVGLASALQGIAIKRLIYGAPDYLLPIRLQQTVSTIDVNVRCLSSEFVSISGNVYETCR